MALWTKTQDLRAYRDLDLDSITMKKLNAEDLVEAATRCIPGEGVPIDGNLFALQMRMQTLSEAVTGYTLREGGIQRLCSGPCLEAKSWSIRTREFLGEMYDYYNSISRDEREGFLMALGGALSAPTNTPGT